MKTIQYTTVDKSTWGPGPWQSEPDKMQFQDEVTGFPCLIVRTARPGHLCGYVGVPESHPCYGKTFYELRELHAHGGINFCKPCSPAAPEDKGICHLPEEGESDKVWWIGFDCGHFGDLQPGNIAYFKTLGLPDIGDTDETYRNVAYVKGQIADLAIQLLAAMQPQNQPDQS